MDTDPTDARTTRPTPRWRAKIVTDELTATDEPVPALMTGWGAGFGALLRESGQIRPLPDLGQGATFSAPAGAGQGVFFERRALLDDESLPWMQRHYGEGIYRLQFSDMSCERIPFEPRSDGGLKSIGASPSGQQVLITENWLTVELPPVPQKPTREEMTEHSRIIREASRVTLTLVDLPTGAVREIDTLHGGATNGTDCLGVQWSPDSTKVAVSLVLDPTPTSSPFRLRVYDTATGSLIGTAKNRYLRGSLSWSPDSTRLLVSRMGTAVGTIAVLDITTGTITPIPALPDPMPDPPGNGKHRLLGFTPDDRLFTVTHRGRAMTLWRMHPTTGTTEPLARWSGSLDLYPTLGPMPADYWN